MSKKIHLLVVDDEPNIRRILQAAFERNGYSVTTADCAEMAIKILAEATFDVVLSDATMPGKSGYELLAHVRTHFPQTPMLIMTAFGTIPQAVQAIRDGASEYIVKPFDLDHVKKVVAAACRPSKSVARVKASGESRKVIAESKEMQSVIELAEKVAKSKATVMIGGESGAGKEMIARMIHQSSSRSHGPFVAVSCAAIPETLLESELFGFEKGAFTGADQAKPGKFEVANGGTLFLDEVGEIPLSVQVKLLRALQEREIERIGASAVTPIDVRVLTATHRDLNEAVEMGTFRLDLLFRLQVLEIVIPPLRERKADIQPLAKFFVEKFCRQNEREELAISTMALERLQAYPWPGNVRELENAMERAVVLADEGAIEIDEKLLPPAILRVAA